MKEYVFSNVDVEFGDARFEISVVHGVENDENAEMADYSPLLHQHIYYEIFLFTEGKGELVTENAREVVREDEILIVKPGIWHHPVKEEGNHAVVLSVLLSRGEGDAGCYDYFKKTLDNFSMCAVRISDGLRKKFLQFDKIERAEDFRTRCMRKVDGYVFLAALFDDLNGFENAEVEILSKRGESETMAMFEAMRNNTDITLKELAKRMNYSTVHVSRLIKQHYGMTLTEIRLSAKIGAAEKLLLEHPEMSVKEVATRARFQNMSTFYHHFKKQVGCTPTEYKQQILGNSQERKEFK